MDLLTSLFLFDLIESEEKQNDPIDSNTELESDNDSL